MLGFAALPSPAFLQPANLLNVLTIAAPLGMVALLTESRVFADITPGIPDGLRVDIEGNVWISAADGVQCHTPGGELIGKIRTPEVVANLAFGGPRNNRLSITATTTVFAVFLNVRGLPLPV